MGIQLAQGFIDHDGDGAGEVEGANVVGKNGDAQDRVGMGGQQIVGESLGFAAKDEGVAGLVFGLGVESGASRAVKEEAGGLNGIQAGLPGGMNLHLNGIPVVQTRAAELGIGDSEAQGFDQMKPCSGGGAKAGDVAGVGRDFRTDQDHVEGNGGPLEDELGFAGMGMFHGGPE